MLAFFICHSYAFHGKSRNVFLENTFCLLISYSKSYLLVTPDSHLKLGNLFGEVMHGHFSQQNKNALTVRDSNIP